ncbi:MAG: hypothetical protein JWO59_3100 [Chloroflexi bacterium]|nr:hypothetical protein [Chloroflexota bacterium]
MLIDSQYDLQIWLCHNPRRICVDEPVRLTSLARGAG